MDDLEPRIRELLSRGRKIEAIKVWRESTGADLREAKDRVERIESGLPQGRGPAPSQPEPADLTSEVNRLVSEGNSIEAIRLVRERTGLGLKEAKERVDAAARNTGSPTHPKAGCLGVLALLAAALAGLIARGG